MSAIGNTAHNIPQSWSIDFLTFTHKQQKPDTFLKLFSTLGIEFEYQNKGLHGYSHSGRAFLGAIQVHWNQFRSDMGTWVTISSKGLDILKELGHDLLTLIKTISEIGVKWTRIDLAKDTDKVHISHVLEATNEGFTRGHSKNCTRVLQDRTTGGTTLYFGQRTSAGFVRVYNKAAEQNLEGTWTRFEWEFKQEKAQRIVNLLLSDGFNAVIGACRSQLEFCDPTTQKNTTRWKAAKWFDEIIVEPFRRLPKLATALSDIVMKKMTWLRNAVSTSLSLLPDHEIDQLIEEGRKRRKRKHIEWMEIYNFRTQLTPA